MLAKNGGPQSASRWADLASVYPRLRHSCRGAGGRGARIAGTNRAVAADPRRLPAGAEEFRDHR